MSLRLTEAEYGRLKHISRVWVGFVLFWTFMIILLCPDLWPLIPHSGQESLQAIRTFCGQNPIIRPW